MLLCMHIFVYTLYILQSKHFKYKLHTEMLKVNSSKGFRWFWFTALCLSAFSTFTANAYVAYKIKITI